MEDRQIIAKTKAQPKAVLFLSNEERAVIRQTVAKNLTDPQYSVFIYTCQALGLNPLLNEITAIVYGGSMSIQTMRDGFLTIAHRTGKFSGIESGTKKDEEGNLIGWARVYHKDFQIPVYQEADFEEYTTKRNLWLSKPKTMIKKVAESMALRKAFNISGVYSPEEMEREIVASTIKPEEVAADKERSRIIKFIDQAATSNDLAKVYQAVLQSGDDELKKVFEVKEKELEQIVSIDDIPKDLGEEKKK